MVDIADKDSGFLSLMIHNSWKKATFAPKIKTNAMKIGDKVRFLNEVGGGTIAGFEGKNIVLVEDQDGFEVPMLCSQVVVIETNENNRVLKKKEPEPPAVRILEDDAWDDPADRPIAYKPKAQERKGGELLNVCLAFVPEDSRELTSTRFEAYLINDSNYYVSATFANSEGAAWHLRWQGVIEPNTKQLVETFDRSMLNDLEHLSVQLITWKQDKPFILKPAIGVELRLDTVKFYKLHVFQPSPFFREPALVYDIVRNDRPIKQVFVEAEEVLDALRGVEQEPEEAVQEQPQQAPPRTRSEEREALKAAKRALKEEERALRAKEQAKKAERNPHVSKPNKHPEKEDIIEVDLHINALLDHTEGLSASVLLNTQLTEFRIMMERNIRKHGQRIVFIHGKGDGVLREAIIKELQHRYRSCTYEDASFQRYGFGATMVTIR